MPHFIFTHRDEEGRVEPGEVDAANVQEARRLLLDRGIDILSLTEVLRPAEESVSRWTEVEEQKEEAAPFLEEMYVDPAPPVASPSRSYEPLVDTFRLYAGWLLAWYFVIFALGSYQVERTLPVEWEVLSNLLHSTLLLRFSFALFLFLTLSALYRIGKSTTGKALILSLSGLILLGLFIANT